MYNDNSFKIEGKEPREIYEAINHKKALDLLFENLNNNEKFDERFIKQIKELSSIEEERMQKFGY